MAGTPGGGGGTGGSAAGVSGTAGTGATGAAGGIGGSGAAGTQGSGGGAGLFALAARYDFGANDYLCDVDGDGHLDLITLDTVWKGRGDGTFDTTPVVTAPFNTNGASFAGVGDFDGDGKCDMLFLEPEPGAAPYVINALVARGQSDGTFTSVLPSGTHRTAYTFANAAYVRGGAFTDVNGDGLTDVIFAGTSTGGTATYVSLLGQPRGSYYELAPVVTPDSWFANVNSVSNSVGDVDGDGYADIAVGVTGAGQGVYVVYGMGGGYFDTTRTTLVTASPSIAWYLDDLDNDGKADPVVLTDGTFQVFWSLGGGKFLPGPLQFYSYRGDFNGDGKTDLESNTGSGSQDWVEIHLNDGARGFPTYATIPSLGAMVGDLDGDGASDLVISPATGPGATSVYLSTAKHPGPAVSDIQCGTLLPSECTGPSGF
jgi:hypothetical protein